jgi:hypothetical protein
MVSVRKKIHMSETVQTLTCIAKMLKSCETGKGKGVLDGV